MIISHILIIRTRNVSAKGVENIKTHISCSITFFFFFENRAVVGKIL